MSKTVFLFLIAAVLLISLFVSCPAPFNAEQLELLQDTDSPSITIVSPSDYSEYSTVIELKCTIEDDGTGKSSSQNTITARYEIPGTTLSGTLSPEDDGKFSAAIDASTLEGSHTIRVTATDTNGNSSTRVINIVEPEGGGDISGFTLTPANKQVTIEWNPVPYAESYTLYEYTYGETRTGVTSPYVWDGLNNGDLYSFKLMANIPSEKGPDAWSATIKTLPLSARTFTPIIRETGYKSITIEWWDDTNISAEYRVERSTFPDGPWKVRRSLTSTTFTDTQVETDTEYRYRVYLAEYPDIVSSSVSVMPANFVPFDKVEPVITSTGVYANSVEISGSYAYVGDIKYMGGAEDVYKGLVIFDISNPDAPVILGQVKTPEPPAGIAVSGNHAYVSDDSNGLVIVDISNKSSPFITGTYDTSDKAYDVAVSGSYAYVADGSDGLVIVDISDPSLPALAGSYDTAGDAKGVSISGNYAYVADGANGLVIVDISDPSSPALAGSYNTAGDAKGVSVSGNYAYVADGTNGLVIVDISDPSLPALAGSYDTNGDAKGVSVSGNYAYVADDSNGLVVVDVSNPSSPAISGTINSYTSPDAYDVAVSGSHAFIANNLGGLVTVNVAVPDHAEVLGSASGVYHSGGVSVSAGYAYVADKNSGAFSVVSIADPTHPLTAGTTSFGASAAKVAVSGSHAYVANKNDGMTVYDISDPASPTKIANTKSIDSSGNINDIAVSGEYVVAADVTNGLVIYDVSDPADPVSAGSYGMGTVMPQGIAVSGNYAFVAALKTSTTGEFDVFDITDPSQPSSVAVITNGLGSDDAKGIDIDSSHAYIAAGSSGLVIYDISNPSTLNSSTSALGTCDTAGEAMAVAVHGYYAYVADKGNGLVIIDVSDPSSPQIVSTVPTSNDALDVCVNGKYAYVAVDGFSYGLKVIQLWEDM